MARRPLNRLEKRREYEAAEALDPVEAEVGDMTLDDLDDESPRPKRKAAKAAKPRAKAATKARTPKAPKPTARLQVVWNIVNDAYKVVEVFAYPKKEEAEARIKELNEKGKGVYFLQRAKVEMPDDAPGLGATIPRPEPAVSLERADDEEEMASISEDEEEEVEEEEDDSDDD